MQPSYIDLLRSVLHFMGHGELPPTTILTLLLSKTLGYGILAGSVFVKVPQILTIQRAKSAEGLSASSFELEEVGLAIHTAYGYLLGLPFSAYGEAIILLLQNTYLLVQIYKYTKVSTARPGLIAVLMAGGVGAIFAGSITNATIRWAYELNNVIFTAARLPQIVQNFQSGGTGQLSSATSAANFLGCLARIFTSHQEGGGMSMIRGYIIGAVLNGTILFQIIYYSSRSKLGGGGKKKRS